MQKVNFKTNIRHILEFKYLSTYLIAKGYFAFPHLPLSKMNNNLNIVLILKI